MDKKISVIVPIYHVENYMDRCIKSIINQSYKNLEIILVDDGSHDKCTIKCDEWAQKDTRVLVIHQENKGLSGARNTGLKQASGEYIMYVDSDDYIEKKACEKLVFWFDKNVDIVVGNAKEINGNKVSFQQHTNILSGKVYSSKEFVVKSINNNEWYAPTWLNMYKKDFLLKNNLFFKEGILYEDIQILPRLFLAANKVVYTDYTFYNYIIRENSIMTSKHDITIPDIIEEYNDWMNIITSQNDIKYRNILYGAMVKYYLHACRVFHIQGWNVKGMSFGFSLKFALNTKERMKVLLFQFFPFLFYKN